MICMAVTIPVTGGLAKYTRRGLATARLLACATPPRRLVPLPEATLLCELRDPGAHHRLATPRRAPYAGHLAAERGGHGVELPLVQAMLGAILEPSELLPDVHAQGASA